VEGDNLSRYGETLDLEQVDQEDDRGQHSIHLIN